MNNNSFHSSDDGIILGVDPGTRISGYGIICIQNQRFTPLDYGCIRPPTHLKLSERYLVIFDSIEELIQKYQPTALVVETQYMYKNAQSALKLGMAKAAVMLAAKKRGLPIFEYAPTVAKRAVVGTGRASKWQVQGMVQRRLQLPEVPQPEDAADALALAICHAQATNQFKAEHEV